MAQNLPERKTGEDVAVNLLLTVPGVPDIAVYTQILVTFYFIRKRIKILLSQHATVPLESGLVIEAAAEGKTIRTITINDQTLEMVIPKEDTDLINLATCEPVIIYAEVTTFDAAGGKKKSSEQKKDTSPTCDTPVFNLVKSPVEGQI